MGKREDQAKLRKKHRRGRFARFSGGQTKHVSRFEQRLLHHGDIDRNGNRVNLGSTVEDQESRVRLETVEIYVGKISLSKQVVNGGKSYVNHERMDEYFDRVRTKEQPLSVGELFGVHKSTYQGLWDDTPSSNKVNFYSNSLGRLDMFWHGSVYFFVEVVVEDGIIRRSREYNSPQKAKAAELNDDIRWVEKIPIKS